MYTGASLLSPSQVRVYSTKCCSYCLSPQYLPLLKSIPILLPLIHISLTASVYTTMAVAVERYSTLIDALKKLIKIKLFKHRYNVFSRLPSAMDGSSSSSFSFSPSPTILSGSLSSMLILDDSVHIPFSSHSQTRSR